MKISNIILTILIIVLLGSITYYWIDIIKINKQSQKNLDYVQFSYDCMTNMFMNKNHLNESDKCSCLVAQKDYVKDDVFLQTRYLDNINRLMDEKC